MTIGREDLSKLLGRLVSRSPEERDEASSVVRDWAHLLDDFERRALIRLLALIASVERDPTARESQLAALGQLSGPGAMTRGDVEPVFEIRVDDLDPSEREHVQGIRADLDEADRFWTMETTVIREAVAVVKHDLAATRPDLRWRTSYAWPARVFPYRVRASVTPDHSDDHAESVDLFVDLELHGTRLRITSGLRDSNGQTIAEGPAEQEPATVGAGRAEWIRQQLGGAAEFIRGCGELLRERLAE